MPNSELSGTQLLRWSAGSHDLQPWDPALQTKASNAFTLFESLTRQTRSVPRACGSPSSSSNWPPTGCPSCGPPRRAEGARRGAHVTFEHPRARWMVAGLAERQVVIDHLEPDRIGFGPGPLFTRYVDVWDAIDRLHAITKEIS